jgi:hypothetical protein
VTSGVAILVVPAEAVRHAQVAECLDITVPTARAVGIGRPPAAPRFGKSSSGAAFRAEMRS